MAALEEGLVADEDRVTDLERVRVQDEDADADLHANAEGPADRPQHDPARAGTGGGVHVARGAVPREQLLLRLGRAEIG